MAPFRVEAVLDMPARTYFVERDTAAFQALQCKVLGMKDVVLVSAYDDGSKRWVNKKTIPNVPLPGPVQKLLGDQELGFTDTLGYPSVEEQAASSTKAFRVEFTSHSEPAILKKLVHVKGSITVEEIDADHCRQVFEGVVNVKVPVVKQLVEPMVIKGLQQTYDNLPQAVKQWKRVRKHCLNRRPRPSFNDDGKGAKGIPLKFKDYAVLSGSFPQFRPSIDGRPSMDNEPPVQQKQQQALNSDDDHVKREKGEEAVDDVKPAVKYEPTSQDVDVTKTTSTSSVGTKTNKKTNMAQWLSSCITGGAGGKPTKPHESDTPQTGSESDTNEYYMTERLNTANEGSNDGIDSREAPAGERETPSGDVRLAQQPAEDGTDPLDTRDIGDITQPASFVDTPAHNNPHPPRTHSPQDVPQSAPSDSTESFTHDNSADDISILPSEVPAALRPYLPAQHDMTSVFAAGEANMQGLLVRDAKTIRPAGKLRKQFSRLKSKGRNQTVYVHVSTEGLQAWNTAQHAWRKAFNNMQDITPAGMTWRDEAKQQSSGIANNRFVKWLMWKNK